MNSSHKVLIPIDFSDASKAAVKYALSEKEYQGYRLILLHSYRLIADKTSENPQSPVSLRKSLEDQLKVEFQRFYDELEIKEENHDIEFRVQVGFPVNCIENFCHESKIDDIVYVVKANKENHMLTELIEHGCGPIKLISERLNSSGNIKIQNEFVQQSIFKENRKVYLDSMNQDPNLILSIV